MKKYIKIGLILLNYACLTTIEAQSVEDILKKMYDNLGGKEKFEKIEALKIEGELGNNGVRIPATLYQTKPNKMRLELDIQGQVLFQAYNGHLLWGQNGFRKGEIRKMTAEETAKFEDRDFPDRFLYYQDRAKKLALDGKETIEGKECFRLKMTNKKGEEKFIFIDKQNYRPILERSFIKVEDKKKHILETYMSDYKEVDGLFFSHTLITKMNGEIVQTAQYNKYTINPIIDVAIFECPKTTTIEYSNTEEKILSDTKLNPPKEKGTKNKKQKNLSRE